jgi:hypothetical protein
MSVILQRLILQKKIMLRILQSQYTVRDRTFKISHLILAGVVPLLALINESILDRPSRVMSILVVVLGAMSTGVLKIRDTVEIGKIRETCKAQSHRYTQLITTITSEDLKPDDRRAPIQEFLYWANREYITIEKEDPDFPHSVQEEYAKTCRNRGINIPDDLDELANLVAGVRGAPDVEAPVVELAVHEDISSTVDRLAAL